MNDHGRKLIAPIIITILLVSYFLFSIPFLLDGNLTVKSVFVLFIPLGFIGVSIYVLIERIKEIRSGDEDDLGKY